MQCPPDTRSQSANASRTDQNACPEQTPVTPQPRLCRVTQTTPSATTHRPQNGPLPKDNAPGKKKKEERKGKLISP
ncbi:uncharacterized protein P884DRAFT_258555 [Thermothelomyces heterothallicus CBS 202.75]|uniref:uncharacterized protein n=1 Tax=Thermothelomyces heterothallicus CBS 202.75 TaxID=1149848 RepID=UPI0037426596